MTDPARALDRTARRGAPLPDDDGQNRDASGGGAGGAGDDAEDGLLAAQGSSGVPRSGSEGPAVTRRELSVLSYKIPTTNR